MDHVSKLDHGGLSLPLCTQHNEAMRRLFMLASCAVLVALSALIFATKSSAQQSDEIQKYIDVKAIEFLPQIEAVEEQYLKETGHYWQGLQTHTEAAKPAYDLADKVQPITSDKSFPADCLECKPTDQRSEPSWSELFPTLVDTLPADLSIDVYDGAEGRGYVINLSYCVDRVCYFRSVQVGSEAWRSHNWIELEPSNEVIK